MSTAKIPMPVCSSCGTRAERAKGHWCRDCWAAWNRGHSRVEYALAKLRKNPEISARLRTFLDGVRA